MKNIWGRFGMAAALTDQQYRDFVENPEEKTIEYLEQKLFYFSGETYFPEDVDDNPQSEIELELYLPKESEQEQYASQDSNQVQQTVAESKPDSGAVNERAYVRELFDINMENQSDAGYLSSADINVLNRCMDAMVDEYTAFTKTFPNGYADIALDAETDKIDEIINTTLKREQEQYTSQMTSMEMG